MFSGSKTTRRSPIASLLVGGLVILIHLVLFPLLANAQVPEALDRTLIARGDSSYYPYEFLDEQGQPAGFNIDLLRAVGDELGLEIDIILGPWTIGLDELEAEHLDIITGVFNSRQLADKVDFSLPYLRIHHSIFTRKGSLVRSLADLHNKEVLVQRGKLMQEYLRSGAYTDRVIEVESPLKALEILSSGQYDCAVLPELMGVLLIEQHGFKNLKEVRPPILETDYGFAVKKGDRVLRDHLNEGLGILHANGRYEEIYYRWFSLGTYFGHFKILPILKIVAWTAGPVLLLIGGILVWTWSLRAKVRSRTRELQIERDRAHMYLDIAGTIMGVIDGSGTIEIVNRMACETLGRTPEELIGKNWFDIGTPQSQREDIRQWWADMFAGKIDPVENFDADIVTKDGDVRIVEWQVIYLRNSDGLITRAISSGRDVTERRRAEDALTASEERYRTVANFNYDWEYWIGPNGRYIYVSPSCFRITGYRADEFIEDQDLLAKITHPADRVSVIEHFQKELEEPGEQLQEHPYFDFRIITRQGELRWMSHVCQPVFGQNGEWLGRRGSNRDITEKKLANSALRASEERYRGVVETMNEGLALAGPDYLFSFVNQKLCEMLGYTPEEMIGHHVLEFVHDDDKELMAPQMEKLAHGQGASFELNWQAKDGRKIPTLSSPKAFMDSDGNFLGSLGVITDITSLKQAETALRESEERYRRVIETMSEGMAMSDAEYRFTFVNDRFCEMLGYLQEEMLGQYLVDFINEDDREMFRQKMVERKVGRVGPYELTWTSKDGRVVYTIISPKELFDNSGKFIGSFAVVTDITELKRAEQQLRAANELKTNFIRVAGHELRTPLSYLLGTARLVKDSHDPARLAQAIHHMDSRAKRMSDIVQSMFKLMPDLAGAIEMHYSRVNTRELLESIDSDYESYLSQRGQQLIIEISPDAVELDADEDKLRDLLENLLTNAIKFTPDGGQVRIIAKPAGEGMLSFAVTDQGGGIPEEDLPYIFEPFFTGKDVMRHSTGLVGYKKRGMGLGLAIVKQFVGMHGGTVTVESSLTGSTIEIKLPTRPVNRDPSSVISNGAGI